MQHYKPLEVFPYVYLLHYLPTDSYYVGSRSQNIRSGRPPAYDLFQYYFSSSTTVKRLLEESGPSSFRYSIIATFDTAEETLDFEDTLYWELLDSVTLLNRNAPGRLDFIKCWYLLSKEEKEERRKNIRYNALLIHKNMTPEEKEKWKDSIRQAHRSRSQEYREYLSQKQSERYQALTEEQKKEWREHLSEGQLSISLEQRELINKKRIETITQKYGSYEEWCKLQGQKLGPSVSKFLSSLTFEERSKRAKHARKTQLENRTPEELEKWKQKFHKTLDSLSPEEKERRQREKSVRMKAIWAARKAKQIEMTN